MRTKINQLSKADINKTVTVKGWVRSIRSQKAFAFIVVNDGSNLTGLQVILDSSAKDYDGILSQLHTGCSVAITGTLVASVGKEQEFELKADEITVIGPCDPETYPLQKKGHSFEFLRTIAHLRPRTNTFGAIARVRNALAMGTHTFFQDRGFLYLTTPIITGSDSEGAGQMFTVTSFDLDSPAKTEQGRVDFEQDFFGRHTYLTVSGQLEAEAYASALSDVYTFSPTFRAEDSNTSRHLAEFWMIEPEMAFADLTDDMQCAEVYLKYCLEYLLQNCPEDMKFFDSFISKGLIAKLEHVINSPFERISYTQALEILKKAPKKFEYPVAWDTGLQSEHERYLTEEHFKKPVIVYDYPQEIKAFYMRLNDDNKTVAAMDVLVPGVGELIGGSQREDRLEYLEKRMDHMGLPKEHYWWYLELRKYGSVPHAGFGLGFERLVMFATGMENIRDVIPFPRYPKHADF